MSVATFSLSSPTMSSRLRTRSHTHTHIIPGRERRESEGREGGSRALERRATRSVIPRAARREEERGREREGRAAVDIESEGGRERADCIR